MVIIATHDENTLLSTKCQKMECPNCILNVFCCGGKNRSEIIVIEDKYMLAKKFKPILISKGDDDNET